MMNFSCSKVYKLFYKFESRWQNNNFYCKRAKEKNILGYNYNSRFLQSSLSARHAHKDGISVLPSPQEVTVILCKNEYNKEFPNGSVKSYDSNQLSSNDPMEDMRSEAMCKHMPGLLFGVFDGHGGPQCAQVVSKRLLKYIAASILSKDVLENYLQEGSQESLIEIFNDTVRINPQLEKLYEDSYRKYLSELAQLTTDRSDISGCIKNAILRLDDDISNEVIDTFKVNGVVDPNMLAVALSGAVACVSYVAGPHLYVANVGDCNAVVGSLTDENDWLAKKITKEHNSEHYDELKRIWSEHPESERTTVIRRDRLLGELAPLRSLGDNRYKWSVEHLNKIAVPLVGRRAVPPYYYTPPYLSAKPDLFYHRLQPKDKLLIIASDGLWDMMTPLQAVKLVGEHMKGKVFFNPLKLPRKNTQLGEINELLLHRKESLKSKPKDRNAATHLIRHAIGGSECGVDHARLAHLLSLSPDVSRMFRDDITVTVVYFDSEYLRQCPS